MSLCTAGPAAVLSHKYDSGAKKQPCQPKEEVFGTDIPRTSRGHLRGYPGPKLRSGPSKPWSNKHFGATCMTRRRGRPRPQGTSKNFGQKNFGLNFRSLYNIPLLVDGQPIACDNCLPVQCGRCVIVHRATNVVVPSLPNPLFKAAQIHFRLSRTSATRLVAPYRDIATLSLRYPISCG